jgi:hypothetical protein
MVAHALETSGCRGAAPGRAGAWTSSPERRRRRRPSQAPAAPCVHERAACPCICELRPDDAAAPVARAGTDDAAAPSHRPPCDCGAVKPVCARAAHCGTPRATRSCTTPSSNLVRAEPGPGQDCGAAKPVCARAAHCGTPRATRFAGRLGPPGPAPRRARTLFGRSRVQAKQGTAKDARSCITWISKMFR